MVARRRARRPGAGRRDCRRSPALRAPSAPATRIGITSIYLQGIDNAEIIEALHARRAPMVPVSASLRL
jgi:hypothetical protein